jgi:hypothetical protein
MASPEPISRRMLLGGAGAAIGLGIVNGPKPAATAAADLTEADKVSKADAKYQDHPKGQQRCGICLNFTPPSTCKIVRGSITASGWCQFFAARENAH